MHYIVSAVVITATPPTADWKHLAPTVRGDSSLSASYGQFRHIGYHYGDLVIYPVPGR